MSPTARPATPPSCSTDARATARPSHELIAGAGRHHRREDRAAPRRQASTARSRPTCTRAPTCRRRSACWCSTRQGDDAESAPGASPCRSPRCGPTYLSRDEVPADVVENERRVAEETAREEGKPEAALAKIVEGRVNGFFKDNVAARAGVGRARTKKTVKQVLDEAGVNVPASPASRSARPDRRPGRRARRGRRDVDQDPRHTTGAAASLHQSARWRVRTAPDRTASAGRATSGRDPTHRYQPGAAQAVRRGLRRRRGRRRPGRGAARSPVRSPRCVAPRHPGRGGHRRRQLLPRRRAVRSAAWTGPGPTTWACSAR